ncbi:SGNH/GDSL hydrolase family protein [bacterium]|nr:SGNH/GDSL hydrolase family protein [bacterium]
MLVWRRRILKIALATLFFAAMLEALLRLLAARLPPNIGNEVVRSYSCERGGIYFRDAPTGLNFCYPNDSRQVIFNGHSWLHQTDSRGFRNPPDTPADILLLGDSFVYGHGVQESDTAAAVLRRDYHWKVYNLARQGDSLSQEYLLFRMQLAAHKPRRVILCAFGNDFWDLKALHTAEQLKNPSELAPGYVEELARRLTQPWQRSQDGNWLSSLYSVRLFHVLWRIWTTPPRPPLPVKQEQEDFSLASGYYQQVFQDMARRCRAEGIDLQVVYVEIFTDNPHWLKTQQELGAFLNKLCAQQGVPFVTTRSLLEGHPELTLPGDGHLNPAGHKTLAQFLARTLPPLP